MLAAPVAAQIDSDPEVRLAPQREAMKALAMLDGTWRGPAWTLTPTGRYELTQTERVGSLLGGTIKIIEGGRVGFNALASSPSIRAPANTACAARARAMAEASR